MNPEIKAQWVAALRSGDYTQGNGVLHRVSEDGAGKINHKFCCLGVLCELAIEAGVADRMLTGSDADGQYRYYAAGGDAYLDGEANYLPVAVRVWAGIDTYSPRVADPGFGGVPTSLADLNDTYHNDFQALADKIENSPYVGITPANTDA